MPQRLGIPKNVGQQHDIRFKIKIAIFAERYPLFY